jgi:hypothetical protein
VEANRLRRNIVLVLGFALSVAAPAASASLIETDFTNDTGFTVPSTNLLQDATAAINDATFIQAREGVTTASLDPLTNLAFGPADLSDSTQVVAISSGALITYSFDLGANPGGVDIDTIETYTGWRDPGRVDQDYMILYSAAADPTTFTVFATVAYDGGGGNDDAVFLSDSDGGPLMTSVAAIQFSFPATENGYVGYRELSAQGTDTPEPASLLLVYLAIVGFARAAVRRGQRNS